MKDDSVSYISDDIILRIGESYKIKIGFANTISLMYGGMPSNDSFSITLIEGTGYQGFAYSLFYPKDTRSISIKEKLFQIISINEESITIRKQ